MRVPFTRPKRDTLAPEEHAALAALPELVKALMLPPGTRTQSLTPAAQTALQQYVAGRAGGKLLPRPEEAFTADAFGPFAPQPPSPLDQMLRRTDMPAPRLWQYPVGWNLPTPPRAYEPVPFETLRAVARVVDVVRVAIQILREEIASADFEITVADNALYKVKGKDYLKDERTKVRAWFEQPDRLRGLYFDEWVSLLMEEVLVTDALSIYPRRDLKGNLYALQILDGATIKPLLDVQGGRPAPPQPAYQQYLYGIPRSEFVAVVGDEPKAQFTAEELIYKPFVTRADSIYGLPPVEQVIVNAITYMRRALWWQSYFTEGDMPAMFVTGADGWTPDEIERYEAALHALLAGDPGWKWRIKVIPFGSKPEQVKQPTFSVDFDHWLIQVVAMTFRITAQELFGTITKSGLGGKGFSEEQEDVQERKGTRPYKGRIEKLLSSLITVYFGQPDLVFRFTSAEQEDEKNQAEVDKIYVSAGVRTINEIREERGWDAREEPAASELLVTTATGPVPLSTISVAPPEASPPGPGGAPGIAGPPAGAPPPSPASGSPSVPPQPKGTPEAQAATDAETTATKPEAKAKEAEVLSQSPLAQEGGKDVAPVSKVKTGRAEPGIYEGHDHQHTTEGSHVHIHEHEHKHPDGTTHTHPHDHPLHQHDTLDESDLRAVLAELSQFQKFARSAHRRPFVFKAVAPELRSLLVNALEHGPEAVKAATNKARLATLQRQTSGQLADNADRVADEADDYDAEDFTQDGRSLLKDAMLAAFLLGSAKAFGSRGEEWAAGKADDQEEFLAGFAADAAGMSAEARAARADLYASGPLWEGYWRGGLTAATGDGERAAKITWHTSGDGSVCDLCDARDGEEYDEDSLPGYPGDGDFGELCEGGVNCRCWLTYEGAAEEEEP